MTGLTEAISERRLLFFSSSQKKAAKAEFERIMLPHLSQLYTAAYYLTKNEAEAEDLVQETYLRAFRFFDKFERGTNGKAWLLSIERNLFINRYRQKKRDPEMVDWDKIDQAYESMIDQSEVPGRNNPENHLLARAMDDEVKSALKKLPEEFRSAIVLVDIQELSYEEAANVMECAVGTVRSRLSRGRRSLQVALREYAIESGIIAK